MISFRGNTIRRKEPCRLCGCFQGLEIGNVQYWNLRQSALVRCPSCGMAQLDPMLNATETEKGCLAYYIEETLRISRHDQKRNLIRNFRRGIHFGYFLKKKGIVPREILELGPGSGYFCDGIRFVFPETSVSVMDINPEILRFNKEQHQYQIYQSLPEEYLSVLEKKFDLVIARDLIEHVSDIGKVLENIAAYLKPGGYFHFITPNGKEDVWKHYLRFLRQDGRSELLINHVNYFDGKGLKNQLSERRFSPVTYYTYTFKTTLRGAGRRYSEKLMAPPSSAKDAGAFIQRASEVRELSFNKKELLDLWYLRPGRKFFARLICWYHHKTLLKVNPERQIGHEFFGLFQSRK
ncbi:MAG: class I SAM-dependent methyltransferase [Syntrophothermus sp.]